MNTDRRAFARHVLLSAAVAAFSSSLTVAQGTLHEPSSVPRAGVAPIHSGADDEGQPYGTWAVGHGYKVGFAGGLQFVPYIGRTDGPAPSFRWRTASARVGECELATADPRLSHGPWRAEYDLGGIVEAYDVRAEGVEQTFVLRERPPTNGDLVIRGTVDTVLHGRAARDGFEFVDAAGVPRVAYGAATAIDARGARRAMTSTLVDGGIELRLDAEWLAAAQFPLVVDPLLFPLTVSTGMPIDEVAIAHDPMGTKNLWLAEVRYTGTDADLLVWRADTNGENPILVFTDVSASWSSIEPALGVNRPGASTIAAWTRHINSGDTRRVRLHVHDRLDQAFESTVILMAAPGARNQWRPTVGHELSAVSFTSSLIAYQVEGSGAFANNGASEIHGAVVSCNGTGSVVSQFPIAAEVGVDQERPSLAKVDAGPTRVWTVAYQRYAFAVGGFDWDIGLRRVDQANVVSAEFLIDADNADVHEMAPRLAGVDDRLMVFATASDAADTLAKPNGSNGHRIRGTRVDWNGSAFVAPHGSHTLQQNGDARLELGGADHDVTTHSHWALTFRSNVTQTVYMRVYGYTGAEIQSHTLETPSTGLGTSIAGGVTSLANTGDFTAAYGIDDPGVGSYLRVRAVTDGYPPAWFSGTGCATTQLYWYGPRWIGSEFTGVGFVNAPANSITMVVAALSTASLQMFGFAGVHDGCWLLVPISGPDYITLFGPIAGPDGNWSIPLPEWLDDDQFHFQGITLDGTTNEFFTTNRMTVEVNK